MKAFSGPEGPPGPRIAIVDYDMGNRRSVENAFRAVGATPVITRDPDQLEQAVGLVLPGVGAYPKAIENIRGYGLDKELNRARLSGKPILGICLGHQLLFEASEEHGYTKGLGFLAGAAKEVSPDGPMNVGWSPVTFSRPTGLNEGLPNPSNFYHLHSYAVLADDEAVVFARSLAYRVDAGSTELVSVVSGVQSDNIYGVQFHPEKSAVHPGLDMIRNFVQIAGNNL